MLQSAQSNTMPLHLQPRKLSTPASDLENSQRMASRKDKQRMLRSAPTLGTAEDHLLMWPLHAEQKPEEEVQRPLWRFDMEGALLF